MDNKFGLLLLCSTLCICVTHCRPESQRSIAAASSSTKVNDQMVFPDSGEDESPVALQMKRALSPTPAANTACRPIEVFRLRNGTLTHRYMNCNENTTAGQSVTNRFSGGDESNNKSSTDPENNQTPVRVAGVPISGKASTSRPVENGGGRDIPISDNIVFPDNDSTEFQTAVEPECANGQRFCTEDASYPKSQIEQLLQRVDHLDDLLHSDVPDDTELTQRVDVPGEETFCDYDSKMEYPTKALSRDEKWLPIVNHANYTQGIRMEMCRNPERPCKMADVFPSIIKTRCVQKYQFRQLLALHEDGQLRRDFFSIPTCCVCTFSKM